MKNAHGFAQKTKKRLYNFFRTTSLCSIWYVPLGLWLYVAYMYIKKRVPLRRSGRQWSGRPFLLDYLTSFM